MQPLQYNQPVEISRQSLDSLRSPGSISDLLAKRASWVQDHPDEMTEKVSSFVDRAQAVRVRPSTVGGSISGYSQVFSGLEKDADGFLNSIGGWGTIGAGLGGAAGLGYEYLKDEPKEDKKYLRALGVGAIAGGTTGALAKSLLSKDDTESNKELEKLQKGEELGETPVPRDWAEKSEGALVSSVVGGTLGAGAASGAVVVPETMAMLKNTFGNKTKIRASFQEIAETGTSQLQKAFAAEMAALPDDLMMQRYHQFKSPNIKIQQNAYARLMGILKPPGSLVTSILPESANYSNKGDFDAAMKRYESEGAHNERIRNYNDKVRVETGNVRKSYGFTDEKALRSRKTSGRKFRNSKLRGEVGRRAGKAGLFTGIASALIVPVLNHIYQNRSRNIEIRKAYNGE